VQEIKEFIPLINIDYKKDLDIEQIIEDIYMTPGLILVHNINDSRI
jgi:hypothetical protein